MGCALVGWPAYPRLRKHRGAAFTKQPMLFTRPKRWPLLGDRRTKQQPFWEENVTASHVDSAPLLAETGKAQEGLG